MANNLYGSIQDLVKGKLWLRVLIGLFLGVITGMVVNYLTHEYSTSAEEAEALAEEIGSWLALPGTLFIKLIKMIMVPVVVSSIILGLVASESIDQLRKMGIRIVFYFVFTTTVAIIIGVFLALVIQPGQYMDLSTFKADSGDMADGVGESTLNFDSVPSFVTNLLPNNPLFSLVQAEMLGVVISTLIFGVAIYAMNPRSKQVLLDLLASVQEICMIIVDWAMKIAPIAVFGLLAQLAAKTGLDALIGTAFYMATAIGGLLVLLVFYMLLLTFLGRKNPLQFLGQIKEVQLLAFSTSSSAATMPLSLKTAGEILKLKPSVYQFIVPIGATVNMDGTALYQGVATLFLAQAFGIELSLGAIVLMIITVVLASIGTPATPGVGIIILATVLKNVGVPPEGIAIILGVDRIVDMCRTVLNVTGDLTASVIFDRWFRD